MKCSYCGASVEKGRLFCMNCGEEIQWVPEYNAIGSYRMRSENSTTETPRSYPPIKPSKPDSAAGVSLQKTKRKKTPLVAGAILMILCLCALLGVKYYMDQKNYNSFDYQLNMAETDYSNHEWDTAYEYIERAILLNSESIDAVLLKAQILMGMEKQDKAISALLDLIEAVPDNTTAYSQLIRIYETQQEPDKIKELLDSCKEESILEKFDRYIASKPVLSLPSGDYDNLLTIELYSPDGDKSEIYYTTDGSAPDKSSSRYLTGINLPEGITELQAITINERGISSNLAKSTYHIKLLPPNPPKISPTSGEFTPEMDTKIYVLVPEGCTAYYAYDTVPTTESTQYMEPIEMPEGAHTFYAILVDKHGKQSEPGSASYVLGEQN